MTQPAAGHNVKKGSNTVKTCIIYCRVSTRDLRDNGTSLDSQADACLALAERQGWQVLRVVQEDYSGYALEERQLFAGVREDIRKGRANVLLCYHPDRMTRHQTHALIIFDGVCEARAELWFAQLGITIEDSPMGRAMLSLYVTGAAMEREQIRERTMRGRRRRLLDGKIHNAGVPLYGYRRNKELGKREIYEPEALVVREIFRLCTEDKLGCHGITLRLIERGIPSPSIGRRKLRGEETGWQKSAVWRILRNESYMGVTIGWKRTTCGSPTRSARPRPENEHVRLPDDTTPALVSSEVWDAAQRQLNTNRGFLARNRKKQVLLRGHVFCGYCNRAMYPTSDRRQRYRCYSQETPGATKCANKRILAEKVEAFAWQWVALILNDPEIINKAIRNLQSKGPDPQWLDDLRIAQEALEKNSRAIERLVHRLATADDEDAEFFERELSKLKKERAGFKAMTAELEQRIAASQKQVADLRELREYARRERERISEYGFEEKREAIEKLRVRVYVMGDIYRVDVPVKAYGEITGKHTAAGPSTFEEFYEHLPAGFFPAEDEHTRKRMALLVPNPAFKTNIYAPDRCDEIVRATEGYLAVVSPSLG